MNLNYWPPVHYVKFEIGQYVFTVCFRDMFIKTFIRLAL